MIEKWYGKHSRLYSCVLFGAMALVLWTHGITIMTWQYWAWMCLAMFESFYTTITTYQRGLDDGIKVMHEVIDSFKEKNNG